MKKQLQSDIGDTNQVKPENPRLSFFVEGEELKKLKEIREHKCQYFYNPGAIGGRLTYSFTPTSLGVVIVCKCACGMEVNVTNYSEW